MKISQEVKERMCKEAVGKVVKSLKESVDDGGLCKYWVMTFTDGSEVCFRFMAELTYEQEKLEEGARK